MLQYIFTIFNDSFAESPLQPYLNELSKNAPDQQIVISGYQTVSQNLSTPSNVIIMNSIDEIKEFIKSKVAQQ